jgi:CO dehydrogenase/acetyl-CoA synthase delta subunit
MPVDVPKQQYTGSIRELNLGKEGAALIVGGESAFPFYTFEGKMPNSPKIAIPTATCWATRLPGREKLRMSTVQT